MSDVELEAFYKEHLEESIIKQLSKQENISLDEAMNLYYNSKLANYIHEGKYDIQYLDYKVLTDNLIKELQNKVIIYFLE
jgi:membrane peptidoglycan carboxypeptidase